jgi:non-heme chloroperoxidase
MSEAATGRPHHNKLIERKRERMSQASAKTAQTGIAGQSQVFEKRASALRFSEVQLSTSVRLRYAAQGDSAGQPVILLHGYTDSWFSFSRVLPYFEAAYNIFALDQRGHGDSEKPGSGYAVRDFADDIVGFMDALNIESAIVVGHSMGSFIAQQMALAAPERVAKLVLVASATTARNEGVVDLQREVEALYDPVPAEFARAFQESTIYQPLPEDFMERAIAESLKLPARVWRAALKGLLEAEAAPPGDISAPTLILWGDRDSIFPRAEQDALAAALQKAVLKVYPETGHALHWERPQQFVKDLQDFISGAELQKGSAVTQ